MTTTFKQSQVFSFMLAALAVISLSVLISPSPAQASELSDNRAVTAESSSEEGAVAAASSCGSILRDTSNISGWSRWIIVRESGCRGLYIGVESSQPACKAYFASYLWSGSIWYAYVFKELTPNTLTEVYRLASGEYTATAFWTNGRCGVFDLFVQS